MITRPFRTLLAALAGLCPFAITAPHAAVLMRGRCHMDTCAWFSIEETDLGVWSRDVV